MSAAIAMSLAGGESVGMKLFEIESVGVSSIKPLGKSVALFRFPRPNLMFTPIQSVSSWASSRTDEPGSWRIGPSDRVPEAVHPGERSRDVLGDVVRAPNESVLVMIPALDVEERRLGLRIGFVL